MKLERITQISPAWDKRNPDPKKDFGIGHVMIIMVLKGSKGACHFSFSTGMLLESTVKEYIRTGRAKYEFLSPDNEYYLNKPMGYDVGYHSLKPLHEGQEVHWPTKMRKTGEGIMDIEFDKIGKKPPKCQWLGKPCYCDGSAMRAETFMNILIEKGSDEIWKMLEEDYKEYFGKNENKVHRNRKKTKL